MTHDKEFLKTKFVTGSYESLRDFAEKEGLSYSSVQNLSARYKWLAEKRERNKELAKEIDEKTRKEYAEQFGERRSETLDIVAKLKKRINKMIDTAYSAKEINALASAIYRANEVENNLMSDNGTVAEGVVQIIDDIKKEVAEEYEPNDEETDT